MKKIYLLFATGLFTLGNVNAQTYYTQDFQSVTAPALPSGWTSVAVSGAGSNAVWKTGTSLTSDNFPIPAHTTYAAVNDDAVRETNNSDTRLNSESIAIPSGTSPFLSFSTFYAGFTGEVFNVNISTNGGTTWTLLGAVPPITAVEWQSRYFNLTNYAGQTIQLQFQYKDGNNQWLYGAAIDDIKVFTPPAVDASLTTVTVNSIAAAGESIKAMIMNLGSTTISSLDMQYTIDGGTPVTQNFTGLSIAPFTSQEVTFSTTIPSGLTLANHNVVVTINTVNGTADANTNNNTGNASFLFASQFVQRNGLMEEFTSSTCPPCVSFNSTFDPLINSLGVNAPSTRINVIKYQMNWPNPGNDLSYNGDGSTRRGYYGVTGIPDHYTNGGPGGQGNQAELEASKATNAYATITGSYNLAGDSMFVTVNVKPHFTSTASFRVHTAAIEDYYNYPDAYLSQKDFYHVVRKMFPNGSGTTISGLKNDSTYTYTFKYKYTVDSVAQGNNNFWGDPVNGHLVVFLQQQDNKNVIQSLSIPAQRTAGIGNVEGVADDATVFPVPAKDNATLRFNLKQTSNVKIIVVDGVGRTVSTLADGKLQAGAQSFQINTANLASGSYFVKITTENNNLVSPLSIVK